MADRGRVTRHGGELAERLAEVAAEAARDVGLDPALLGDYPRALVAIAQTRRRLTKAELDSCRARSVTAAERGVSLQSLISLYLTVTRRLWPQLPVVHSADRPAAVRRTAEAVLQATDDATASLAAGYEGAQRMTIRLEEALRREFIDDLLSGHADIELLIERSERFRLQLASSHVVAVIRARQPLADTSPITRQVEAAILARFGDHDVLVATKQGSLVCIVPAATDATVDDLTALLHRTVGERVGIGRPHSSPRGVVQSYLEATEALDLAERLRLPGPVIEADRLLVYRVLLRDRAAIAELVRVVLGPLQLARGGAEPLLATLQAYFAARGVSAVAARRLHVGVRTLTYRLQRVRQLTGQAVTDPDHASRWKPRCSARGCWIGPTNRCQSPPTRHQASQRHLRRLPPTRTTSGTEPERRPQPTQARTRTQTGEPRTWPTPTTPLPALTGALLRQATQRFPQAWLVGIDSAPRMVTAASEATPAGPPIYFVRACAEHLPLADGSFDLAISALSFRHWHDQAAGIAQIRRLRPCCGCSRWTGG